jgi:hypothetical protein
MLELCPRGQEASEFFLFLFLQHLPRELWIMLGDDCHHKAKALAAKADMFCAYHSHQQPDSVAAIARAYSNDEDQPAVAVICSTVAKAHQQRPSQSCSSGKQNPIGVKANPSPTALAMNSGL